MMLSNLTTANSLEETAATAITQSMIVRRKEEVVAEAEAERAGGG